MDVAHSAIVFIEYINMSTLSTEDGFVCTYYLYYVRIVNQALNVGRQSVKQFLIRTPSPSFDANASDRTTHVTAFRPLAGVCV